MRNTSNRTREADGASPALTAEGAESFYTSAAKAELRRDFDSALRLYLKAGSAFLELNRTTGDARWRKEAVKAVERAEKIKASKHDVMPVLRNPFAPEEQNRVLAKGAIVNGIKMPPWADLDSSNASSDGPSTDTGDQIKTSEEQNIAGVTWKRPIAVFGTITLSPADIRAQEIVQRVSDCSLCASIVICLEHSRRFSSKTSIPLLVPVDPDRKSAVSLAGRYALRVEMNGESRRITIDDQLLFRSDGTLLCMSTRQGHNIWPSLIEKACMKINGGYDFYGSNSAVDVHFLVGWIPEHIHMQKGHFPLEQTWKRISEGFHNGSCILTVGTDDKPTRRWKGFSLLTAHSYAIVDVSATDEDERWLTIIDSLNTETKENQDDREDALERMSLNGHEDVGSIRMSWTEMCAVFESTYISWDPSIFAKRTRFHGLWRPSHLPESERDEAAHHVLYLAADPDPPAREMWVLLTRHRTNTRILSEYISLQVESTDRAYPDDAVGPPMTKGSYTNSPHVLIRVPTAASGGTFAIATSYDGQQLDVGYTVEVFSATPTRWDDSPRKLPFDIKLSGAFTDKTAGGNHTLPTYMSNPQFKLIVPAPRSGSSKSRAVLAVQAARDVPVNVAVVWGNGERVFDLTKSAVLASSGAYRYGFARAAAELAPGTYTVVVSAFMPTHLGPFALTLASGVRVALEPIPQEGAGMFAKTVRGALTSGDRAPRYELVLSAPAQVKARLQLQDPAPATSLALAISPSSSPRLTYTDALSGVATPPTALRVGTYALVLAARDASRGARFKLMVWVSSAAFEVRAVAP